MQVLRLMINNIIPTVYYFPTDYPLVLSFTIGRNSYGCLIAYIIQPSEAQIVPMERALPFGLLLPTSRSSGTKENERDNFLE